MKTRVRDLCSEGDKLFGQRQPLLNLWSEIASNFYPERNDFTTARHLGEEFAPELMTGYPVIARRDLGNQFAAMLRPRGKSWFKIAAEDERLNEDASALAWMEWASGVQRRAMYDRGAKFIRATKEGDHDFAAFGQTVLTVELNSDLSGLLYRCWHLRDVVWCESAEGDIDKIHRKWKLPARSLKRLFPKTVDGKVNELCEKEPEREIECRHIIVPSDEYDYSGEDKRARRFPYVSLYVDKEHDTILEEQPIPDHQYVIPRWQTVSGSQYAHSPATVVGLADARLLQRITLTLLEAGEKAVTPPMIATQEAIRSDMQLFAGGVTWVDSEYDERFGEVLRPITQDKSGLTFGLTMAERAQAMVTEAFYLNKIHLPPPGGDMREVEVQARIEEYVRAALPLFEPLETEYNGALCEKTFTLLLRNGAFGGPETMPEVLRGQEVGFAFESPLQTAQGRQKAQAFQEASALLASAVQIDPSVAHDLDIRTAFRDALQGVGTPAKWIVPQEVADQSREEAQQAQSLQGAMAEIGQGAAVAEQVGKAGGALMDAGMV